jgi:TM2 domain-containing membrane protein YozV
MDEPSSESVEPSGETTGSRERGPDEAFCRDCGAVIAREAEICPACGVRQRDPPSSGLDGAIEQLTRGGNPFVAAALSALFPGLGQIYNRELEKGLIVIVASLVSLFLVIFLVGFLLYPLVWLYAIYDAYTVADRQSAAPEAPAEE